MPRPPLDPLWRAIAARVIHAGVLSDDMEGESIRKLVDDLYNDVAPHLVHEHRTVRSRRTLLDVLETELVWAMSPIIDALERGSPFQVAWGEGGESRDYAQIEAVLRKILAEQNAPPTQRVPPLLELHEFVGRLDRWCERCNRPDRDPVHIRHPATSTPEKA